MNKTSEQNVGQVAALMFLAETLRKSVNLTHDSENIVALADEIDRLRKDNVQLRREIARMRLYG